MRLRYLPPEVHGTVHANCMRSLPGKNRIMEKSTAGRMITPGIWNVLPAYKGDHMALQGGLRYTHDIRRFYLTLLRMISRL